LFVAGLVTEADLSVPRWTYKGTSTIRKRLPLGPYRRPVPMVLGGSYGVGHFFMGEVLLHPDIWTQTARLPNHDTGRCVPTFFFFINLRVFERVIDHQLISVLVGG
jgi:hypothetical protein